METTTNNNIKIVRLQSGEDIMADMIQDEENDTILLDNPMHIIFKRIPTGQTVMMMMPWLPIEIIKENSAIVYGSDILTIIEPKDDLVEYYGSVVVEAQQRMEEKRNFTTLMMKKKMKNTMMRVRRLMQMNYLNYLERRRRTTSINNFQTEHHDDTCCQAVCQQQNR